jgi:hypothetical protein
MTTVSFTTKKSRHAAAEAMAATLRAAAPSAEVTITPEGEVYGKRRVSVRAKVNGVESWCDLDGESMACGLVGWYISSREPVRFTDAMAAMIGGSINRHHRMKATGPLARGSQAKRGQYDRAAWLEMTDTWAAALADVALGAEGRAITMEAA